MTEPQVNLAETLTHAVREGLIDLISDIATRYHKEPAVIALLALQEHLIVTLKVCPEELPHWVNVLAKSLAAETPEEQVFYAEEFNVASIDIVEKLKAFIKEGREKEERK